MGKLIKSTSKYLEKKNIKLDSIIGIGNKNVQQMKALMDTIRSEKKPMEPTFPSPKRKNLFENPTDAYLSVYLSMQERIINLKNLSDFLSNKLEEYAKIEDTNVPINNSYSSLKKIDQKVTAQLITTYKFINNYYDRLKHQYFPNAKKARKYYEKNIKKMIDDYHLLDRQNKIFLNEYNSKVKKIDSIQKMLTDSTNTNNYYYEENLCDIVNHKREAKAIITKKSFSQEDKDDLQERRDKINHRRNQNKGIKALQEKNKNNMQKAIMQIEKKGTINIKLKNDISKANYLNTKIKKSLSERPQLWTSYGKKQNEPKKDTIITHPTFPATEELVFSNNCYNNSTNSTNSTSIMIFDMESGGAMDKLSVKDALKFKNRIH